MTKVWKLSARVILINLIATLFVIALTYQVEVFEREREYAKNREIAARELAIAQSSVSLKIITGLNLIEEMRILLGQNFDWSVTDFDNYASNLTINAPEIRNIGVARDFIIEYVSPLKGNEAALNLDYREIPEQLQAVKLVSLKGHTVLTNLVHLVQGGDAIIARIPFLVDRGLKSGKWGFISVVWDVDKLFASITEQLAGMDYEISVKSNVTSAGENSQIFGSAHTYDFDPITSQLPLEGNSWEFAIAPPGAWTSTSVTVWAIRIIGLLLVLIILGVSLEREWLKELLFELKIARIKSDRASASKTKFLANISHDLRTPLNAIIGFSEVMKDQVLGKIDHPKYVEYSKDIHASSKYLLKLVNDLLDISAAESGNKKIECEPLDIKVLITDSWNQIAAHAEEKEIDFNIESTADIPLMFADERAMQQIIINLFTNSIKFTHEGGRLTANATFADNHHIIKIIDTGIGISAEYLEKIFDPFVRDDSDPYHSHEEGTGLGLAIVKALVELHDGTVELESIVGEGTTVTLRIPLPSEQLQ